MSVWTTTAAGVHFVVGVVVFFFFDSRSRVVLSVVDLDVYLDVLGKG